MNTKRIKTLKYITHKIREKICLFCHRLSSTENNSTTQKSKTQK